MMELRNFLSTGDHEREALEKLIADALAIKSGEKSGRPLAGRSVALVFFNPSLRTRASMQVGIFELGGNPVILEPGSTSWTLEHRAGAVMDGGKTEHISEFVRVLERYVDVIGVRTFAEMKDWSEERTDPVLAAFRDHARVPLVNLESAVHHPCQAMADMMTIREHFGTERKKVVLTWAWHPKPLPMAVPNSFALAAAQFGHDVVIVHPEGYELDDAVLAEARHASEAAGGTLSLTGDLEQAFSGAAVVYAKSWGGKQFYGRPEDDVAYRAPLRGKWIVDAEKMALTDNGLFMHCLPVRRNVIVTDAVIDSARSVVIDQAENRLHVQKAILSSLVK